MIDRHHIVDRDGARRAEIAAAGGLIFFSGLQAEDTALGPTEQAAAALARLDALLAEMGVGQSSVLMVHIWLKDMRYFSAMNAAWNAWADPAVPPARTCVSGELSRPDVLVEIVAIAASGGGA